jgi:hypothetical protein
MPTIRPGHREVAPTQPDPDLDRAVEDLNRIYTHGGLKTAVAMGRYILERFFGGDVAEFRSHRGDSISFRALHRRGDLAMSLSTLNASVAVYLQVQQLPRELAWQLSVTRHKALLPLKDPVVKEQLAAKAIREGMPSRELRREVWKHQLDQPASAGPRKDSPPMRFVKKLRRDALALDRELRDGGAFEHLDHNEQRDVLSRLDAVIGRLQRAREWTG